MKTTNKVQQHSSFESCKRFAYNIKQNLAQESNARLHLHKLMKYKYAKSLDNSFKSLFISFVKFDNFEI